MEHLIEQELDFKCNMNKELLIKDLCPRLSYGLVIDYNGIRTTLHDIKVFHLYNGSDDIKDYICLIDIFGDNDYVDVENIKPYLFPMSSMTVEQRNSYKFLTSSAHASPTALIDFFHKHHIDYRGLIPKGLAIDASKLNIY